MIFASWASAWIEEYLNRPGMSYKQRTEYYDGTGTPHLLLRSRPVYTDPPVQVYFDEDGFFGSRTGSFDPNQSLQTFGGTYYLRVDSEDGTSRSGILSRLNSVWPKRSYRAGGLLSSFLGPSPGSIKVVYWAGYTVDNCPEPIRAAANILVTKIRNFMPLGMEIANESYENRYISYAQANKDYLFCTVKDFLNPFRNWRW